MISTNVQNDNGKAVKNDSTYLEVSRTFELAYWLSKTDSKDLITNDVSDCLIELINKTEKKTFK